MYQMIIGISESFELRVEASSVQYNR